MAEQRLVDYLRNGLSKGYSEESLRQALIRQGWSASDISQAFASARGFAQPEPRPEPNYVPPESGMLRQKRKVVLRRVGVLSVAKVSAITGAIFGIIVGIFYAAMFALFGSLFTLMPAETTGVDLTTMFNPAGFLLGMGLLAAFLIPVLFAIWGFISGAIGAFIYNLVAGWFGGFEVEFEQ